MDKPNKEELNLYAFAINLGFRIAIPLVALTLLGRYVDNRFETSPLFLIIGITLSLVITSVMIYTQAIKVLQQSSQQPPTSPPKKKSPPKPKTRN
jgi:F0F1-type ATP synthase assembly protein I